MDSMSEKEKTDMRVIKTERSILNSFIEIGRIKNINLISVNEIVKKAEINRGTFYLHYENKDDFIETISNEKLDEFVLWIKRAQKINSIKSEKFNENKPKDTFFEMFNFVQKNQGFFQVMLGENGSIKFREEMKNTIKNRVYKELMEAVVFEGDCLVDKEFLFEFTSSSCMGMIVWWLKEGCVESPKYVANELSKISILGPIRALGIIK